MNERSPRGVTLRYRHDRGKSEMRAVAGMCRWLAVAGVLAISACCVPLQAHAQSEPTATRLGDLQLGGGLVFAKSGYNFTPIHLIGGAFYTTFDKRNHWGGEASFRQNRSTQDSTVYENGQGERRRIGLPHCSTMSTLSCLRQHSRG